MARPVAPASDAAAGSRGALLLRHGDLLLRVDGISAADRDWFAEALAPAFALGKEAIDDDARVDRHVHLCIDAARHAALLAAAPLGAEAPLVLCFGFDGHVPDIRRLGDGLFHDAELGCLYQVHGPGGALELIAPAPHPALRIALLRVLRELATAELPRRGAVQLHAAAIGAAAGALLVCGPRRAGKTSLLLHLLGSGAVDYIANDRAVAQPLAGGRWQAAGMPTTVSIRAGSVALFPRLRLAELARWRARMTLAEALALPSAALAAAPPDLCLSPAQLCRQLGLRARAQAPLVALLFPRIDAEARGIRLRPLSEPELGRRLETALMPPQPSVLTGWPEAAPVEDADAARRLCGAMPGYDCILGSDAYADAEGTAALLALLGGDLATVPSRVPVC